MLKYKQTTTIERILDIIKKIILILFVKYNMSI
jgi:hypothetical protein